MTWPRSWSPPPTISTGWRPKMTPACQPSQAGGGGVFGEDALALKTGRLALGVAGKRIKLITVS